MDARYVKKTMKTRLAQLLIPHFCCSCGEIGTILCESCVYDIVSEHDACCVACGQLTSSTGRCMRCRLPFSRGWAVGERRGALERLVDQTKFESVREAATVQARLLHELLPTLPAQSSIVPVPTIATHIRQRGFDHAQATARQLAQLRDVPTEAVIGRVGSHVQHGATKRDRERQAATSFVVAKPVSPEVTYIIIDDVYTTGSTVQTIAALLRQAGAGDVWVAVTSRQPG